MVHNYLTWHETISFLLVSSRAGNDEPTVDSTLYKKQHVPENMNQMIKNIPSGASIVDTNQYR